MVEQHPSLEAFLYKKLEDGELSTCQIREIMAAAAEIVSASGVRDRDDPLRDAVLRHSGHVARENLRRLHPDLFEEFSRLQR